MADANLHALRDFFKEISIEVQHLRLIAQHLQIFIDRGRERGARIGDDHLLLILDQLERFTTAITDSSNRLEKMSAPL